MRSLSHKAPWVVGLAIFLAIILLPDPDHLPQRDMARDIASLQQAECEYRGINTTFEELTQVYMLQTYEGSELLRWEARPSPNNPASETLVTAIFKVTGAKESADRDLPGSIVALRAQAAPAVRVSWAYSTLAAVRISPANDYAVDALAVLRKTVDGFISRMVVVAAPAMLHQEPAADSPVLEQMQAGTVLLLQPSSETTPTSSWRYVRIPSTATFGWVTEEELITVEHDR